MHIHADFLQRDSKLLDKSSNICYNKESYILPLVIGHLLCIWCPRRPLETGDHVVITIPSIMLLHLTVTQFHTSKTSLLYIAHTSFPKLILLELTIRFLSNRDVCKWAQACLQCQRCKIQCHTITPLDTFATHDARFDNVHIDIVGPLPPSQGYDYLLTCIDHFIFHDQKLSLSQTLLQKQWLKHSSVDGYHNSEYLLLLQLIVVANLSHHFGNNLCTH